MSQPLSLRELERKAYRSFFADGIWDIYLGLLLLAMGGGPGLPGLGLGLPSVAATSLGLAALAMLFFLAGKKLITIPRLGAVQFGPERTLRRRKTALVLACSALLGVVLLALRATGTITSLGGADIPAVAVVFAANCLIVFALGAYFLDFGRLYAYGLLYAAAFPLGIVLAERGRGAAGFLVAYSALAAPMIAVGAVLLIRFLRRYQLTAPPSPEEST